MTNTELLLELLDEISPKAYCDDCLSLELRIHPRQQVNQLVNRLGDEGKILRQKGVCSLCKKRKTTNAIIPINLPSQEMNLKSVHESIATYTAATQFIVSPPINIEDIRTQVV
jgi:hypothetical protein